MSIKNNEYVKSTEDNDNDIDVEKIMDLFAARVTSKESRANRMDEKHNRKKRDFYNKNHNSRYE